MNQLHMRQLGATAKHVSELGLGGYQFTGEFGVARHEAHAIIGEALGSGVNFVDTAPMYGAGESEELIGRALTGAGTAVVVSGKLGYLDLTVSRYFGVDGYRSEDALRRVAEHSLHLLRKPKFDVLFIHEPEWPEWALDPATGDSVVTTALERMRAEGLTDAIGVAGQDVDLLAALIDTGRFDAVLSVMHYDLTTHRARDILFPAARRHEVGIILGTPLRQGLLARAHAEPINAMVADAERPHREQAELAATLTRAYQLARDLGMPVPELALRYLLSDAQITSVIPGARSVQDVRSNVRAALKGPLPADLVSEIEAMQPGSLVPAFLKAVIIGCRVRPGRQAPRPPGATGVPDATSLCSRSEAWYRSRPGPEVVPGGEPRLLRPGDLLAAVGQELVPVELLVPERCRPCRHRSWLSSLVPARRWLGLGRYTCSPSSAPRKSASSRERVSATSAPM